MAMKVEGDQKETMTGGCANVVGRLCRKRGCFERLFRYHHSLADWIRELCIEDWPKGVGREALRKPALAIG